MADTLAPATQQPGAARQGLVAALRSCATEADIVQVLYQYLRSAYGYDVVALTVLERRPGLSSAELARASFVTAQSMADVVAALRAAGLVTRHRDGANRRRLVLDLTPQGHDVLARLAPAVVHLERLMLSGLDDGQVSQLRLALGFCRAALERGHLTRGPA